MELLLDACLAFLAALGAAALVDRLLGRAILPKGGADLWLLIPGRGTGEDLEYELRGVLRLREMGTLRCGVAIVDVDLTPRGRELALQLAGRWPETVLWPAGALQELFDT